ncbi:MAG: hypothetical protein H7X84_02725 [Verrucomicrobia bacterium]|nr:hypothetical protein [Prolixibacteraceae bacterium]
MRHLRLRRWCRAAVVMAVVVSFNSSCSEDEVILPDYAGSWEAVASVQGASGYTQIKDIMTFTETGFTSLSQVEQPVSKWTDFASMEGTMEVHGDIMSIMVTEIGISSISGINGQPTGIITSYKKGTAEYDALFAKLGESKNFESKFTVSGTKLTLQTDKNNDGDYLDDLETIVYTKK